MIQQKKKTAIETFVDNLKKYGIHDDYIQIEDYFDGTGKVYLHANKSGWGIPSDCYDDVDARLIESCSMKALGKNHWMKEENRDHVLIFSVTYKENNDAN